MIVRSANYAVGMRTGDYEIFHREGLVITRNFLAHLDRHLHLVDVAPITVADGPPPRSRIRGYEDCRLVLWNGSWHALATTREAGADDTCRVVLMRLVDGEFGAVRPLSSPAQHEKNWMPVVYEGELLIVYSCSPTVVLHVTDSAVNEIIRHPGPVIARDFRGGSQGVPVEDGYLFVVHELVVSDRGGRVYLHRFVRTDRDLRITDISLPFYFIHPTVEFCCGLAVGTDDVVVSFGFQDREAFVVSVPLPGVLRSLHPV
jgi:hypothetical protein